MSSLSYELNGRNGLTVSKADIGLIIGKRAQGLKRVISNSWTMYERLQGSDKRIEEEKPKLRIMLKDHEEGVEVEILSESENMRKLAQLSLDKHVQKINQGATLAPREFIVECPHRLLGKLIGKKAANLNRLLQDAKFEGTGKGQKVLIHADDLETVNTARIQVKELKFSSNRELIDFKEVGRNNRMFIGWPPVDDDDYEDHINMRLTFKHGSKSLKDRDLYIERLTTVISDRITQIKDEDGDQMDEINECLGFEEY